MTGQIPGLRLVSYRRNRGRGHALLTGILAAQGDMIFTTEIDCSWGDGIVSRMYDALQSNPSADIVIASPHLRGGGYKNVPFRRVLLSQIGNYIIRAGLSFAVTMNTGMTRGYRRDAILELPLFEDGKEFHLEVVLKALAFGKRIIEVPAILEWKEYKHCGNRVKRKSSSKIPRIVKSHLLFSLVVAPIRHLWVAAAVTGLAGFASGALACGRYMIGRPYAFAILGFVSSCILAVMLFAVGVISQQARLLMCDLWRLQAMLMCRYPVDDSDGALADTSGSDEPRRIRHFPSVKT
jgi:glycosyltransferase involved in cell wall biosynthesis